MKHLLILCIRIYQGTLSGLLGPCCRFHPSCSAYAVEALQKHGALKGTWMAIRRVARCHPFHPGGYDPVPDTAIRGCRCHRHGHGDSLETLS